MEVTAQDFVDGIRYIGDPLNDAYSLRVVRNLIEGLYDYYWTLDDIDSGEVADKTREEVLASFDDTVGVKAIVRTPGGHQTVIVSDTVGKGPVHVGA